MCTNGLLGKTTCYYHFYSQSTQSISDDNLTENDVLELHSPQAPPLQQFAETNNQANNAARQWVHPAKGGSFTNPNYELFVESAGAAWSSSHVGANGHHPPSPCTVTHPPTPPPYSADTANLEAAIEVLSHTFFVIKYYLKIPPKSKREH